MKVKTLRKKIRRLETRLQEGPKKLAKLKLRLEAITTANARKARRKLVARAGETSVKPAGAQRPGAARKVKRKLNLSPERRAQLAAAMKARWAAKRAAAEANPQNSSADRNFALPEVLQSP
jgi:hypothetical protein